MKFNVHLRESLINLFSAKLRSLLAILGVLVGTAAVVALMASSRLATDHALEQFKTLGTNLLAMNLHSTRGSPTASGPTDALSLSNMNQINSASPQIVLSAPYVNFYQPIIINAKSVSGQVLATTAPLQKIAKIKLAKGRFISLLDAKEFYCVIGTQLAKSFSDRHMDPIGKQIKVGKVVLTVVGVAKKWQPNLFLLTNINNAVIVPLPSAYLMTTRLQIHDVLFRLIKNPNIPLVQQQLTQKVLQLLPHQKVQFRNPEQIIKIVSKERETFDSLLIAIGSIALIVGGIGVMNIMLVSVVERRREIGIRMAVGARRSNILIMFLMEAIMLTIFGGIIGIVVGLTVTYILAAAASWTFHFYLLPPVLGFVVSVLVGVLSGFYPAWRASKLDPIACLTL